MRQVQHGVSSVVQFSSFLRMLRPGLQLQLQFIWRANVIDGEKRLSGTSDNIYVPTGEGEEMSKLSSNGETAESLHDWETHLKKTNSQTFPHAQAVKRGRQRNLSLPAIIRQKHLMESLGLSLFIPISIVAFHQQAADNQKWAFKGEVGLKKKLKCDYSGRRNVEGSTEAHKKWGRTTMRNTKENRSQRYTKHRFGVWDHECSSPGRSCV